MEDGTYEELIAQNGKFAELIARQRLDGEDLRHPCVLPVLSSPRTRGNAEGI